MQPGAVALQKVLLSGKRIKAEAGVMSAARSEWDCRKEHCCYPPVRALCAEAALRDDG